MTIGREYGSLVYGLRLEDLPDYLVAKNSAWEIAGCVDGPTEPKEYKYVLQHIFQFFDEHDASKIPSLTPVALYPLVLLCVMLTLQLLANAVL